MMDERFVTIRGQKLRYLVCGQGKPLVLCHGFLSSAEEFGGRFEELGEYRTLIIPDLPGKRGIPAAPWAAYLSGDGGSRLRPADPS